MGNRTDVELLVMVFFLFKNISGAKPSKSQVFFPPHLVSLIFLLSHLNLQRNKFPWEKKKKQNNIVILLLADIMVSKMWGEDWLNLLDFPRCNFS